MPFSYIRADEVAECWEGITQAPGLYEALWALPQNPIPDPEEPCPGHDNLQQHWHLLSPEHQAALIELEKLNG